MEVREEGGISVGWTVPLRDLGCGNSCCVLMLCSMEWFTLQPFEFEMGGEQPGLVLGFNSIYT